MARPLRIIYENAVYHVMNRGQNHLPIFHDTRYVNAFLLCLEEAHQLFGLEIFAYCLMSNHYHLLVRTPRANLSRCMRHINGVYTQRYNKLHSTDGPLFRGRYRAIVVDEDNYFLQVSRYIHRNPIETKIPMVEVLLNYKYSSYPIYLNKLKRPFWLNTAFLLSFLGKQECVSAYKSFVENGNEQELVNFYQDKKQTVVLGSDEFVESIEKNIDKNAKNIIQQHYPQTITIQKVVDSVAHFYQLETQQVVDSVKGSNANNTIARKMAIYLCRNQLGMPYTKIAPYFKLFHYSSASSVVRRLASDLSVNRKLREEYDALCRYLTL